MSKGKQSRCIFTPAFDDVKTLIYACPTNDDEDFELFCPRPSFEACGLTWNFMIMPLDGFNYDMKQEEADPFESIYP